MNLVDLVTSQLSGDVLGKLGGLIGADESQTKSATGAAVPALLSVLAKLSGTKSGADQLASVLGGLDLSTLGNLAGLAGMLGGGTQASGLGTIGGKLLTALLGDNLGKLVGTIAGFAGTNPAIMKTLLTYLAPVVMGVVANQFKGAAIDASGLQRLFADQQENIRAAMPRGLSLADFDTSSASPRRADEARGGHRHEEPASALPAWLPFLLLLLIGGALWIMWPKKAAEPPRTEIMETRRVEGPLVEDRTEVVATDGKETVAVVKETVEPAPGVLEALKMGEGLTGLIGDLGKVLADVSNEDSARAAVPKLEAFSPTLESLVKSTAGLPAAGRSTIVELVAKNLGPLQKAIETVLAIPGVREILGPVVSPMVEKIAKLGKE